MENQSLRRSLSLLTSPSSLLAMGLLFLNDHILRLAYPSWVTGKLGDLAWLYFIPFALAPVFSLALPRISGKKADLPFLAASGAVALVFGAANLSPDAAAWLADRAGSALGLPLRITSDPTDLAALPMLALAYWQWTRWQPRANTSLVHSGPWLVLAGALTLANSMQPDYGVICLIEEGDRLVAGTSWFQFYASSDGGLTWVETPREESYSCDPYDNWVGELALLGDPGIRVRSQEEGQLEQSRDGGATWQTIQPDSRFSQAEAAWVQRTSRMFYRPGPLDAAVDPESGSLVFAMGLEGVLVLEPGGEWVSVPVGEYGPVQLTPPMIPWLLGNELLLALAFALLLIATPGVFPGTSTFQKVWLGLAWGGWLVTLLVLQPARLTGYGTILGAAGVYFTGGSALVLLVLYLIRDWERVKPRVGRLVLWALLGLVAVLLPLVLWSVNILPVYTWAALLAILLGGGVLFEYYRKSTAADRA